MTPAFTGVPNTQRTGKKQEMAMRPKCGQSGDISPAAQRSRRGGEAQMATWPKCGQSGYITTALSGVPNAHRGNKNQKELCSLDVDKVAISHMPSQGSPTLNTRRKHINGYVAQMWTKWLHHPCRLEGLKRLVRRQKSETARQPRCGQSGYITPALSGVPNAQHEQKTHKWLCGPN